MEVEHFTNADVTLNETVLTSYL